MLYTRENVRKTDRRRKQAGDCADTRCSAILKERDSDQFARIVVDIDPAEPHAIKGIELRAIPRPAEFSIPRMTEEEALKGFRHRTRLTVAPEASPTIACRSDEWYPPSAVFGLRSRAQPRECITLGESQ
jgi:hypothetical protein